LIIKKIARCIETGFKNIVHIIPSTSAGVEEIGVDLGQVFSCFENDSIFTQTNFSLDETLTVAKRPFLTDKEINDLRQQSSSGPTLAMAMLEKLFSAKELQEGNVTGRGKDKATVKARLNPEKIQYIEEVCSSYYSSSNKKEFTGKIRQAINRRVLEYEKKNSKSNTFQN